MTEKTAEEELDAKIAKVSKERQDYQAQFDKEKYGYETGRIGALKRAIAQCDSELRNLHYRKAANRPAEPLRSSSVFFGGNF